VEVRKITQKDFDTYWTPIVKEKLINFIHTANGWGTNFDRGGYRYERKWVMDMERGIVFLGVDILDGILHPSDLCGEDVAVVAKNGSFGLLKHQYDADFFDIYKVLLLNEYFLNSKKEFEKLVVEAINAGGLRLNGNDDAFNQPASVDKIKFVYQDIL